MTAVLYCRPAPDRAAVLPVPAVLHPAAAQAHRPVLLQAAPAVHRAVRAAALQAPARHQVPRAAPVLLPALLRAAPAVRRAAAQALHPAARAPAAPEAISIPLVSGSYIRPNQIPC